jgi:CRP/FNR family transcriptional regulator
MRLSAASEPTGLRRLSGRLVNWGLSLDTADDLLNSHTVITVGPNSCVFRDGATADVLYWVRSGLVDLVFSDETAGNLLIDVVGPGELLGFVDVSGTNGSCQIFTARARTRCEIGVLARERIGQLCEKLKPETLVSLGEQINGWWSEKIERWLKFVHLSAHDRLQLVLAELAEKFGVDDAHGKLIVPEFSHEDLASMILASRPMVTRLLAHMIARGHVLRRGARYVLCRDPHSESASSTA